jgi:hypothetical protein
MKEHRHAPFVGCIVRLCENSKVPSKRGSKITADLEKMQYRPNVKVVFELHTNWTFTPPLSAQEIKRYRQPTVSPKLPLGPKPVGTGYLR